MKDDWVHTLRIFPEVQDDLVETQRWHNSQSDGLGEDFIVEFWDTVEWIDEHPKLTAVKHTGKQGEEIRRSHFLGCFPTVSSTTSPTRRKRLIIGSTGDRQHDDAWKSRV